MYKRKFGTEIRGEYSVMFVRCVFRMREGERTKNNICMYILVSYELCQRKSKLI